MHFGKVSTAPNYKRIFLIFLLLAVIFSVAVLYFVMGKAEIVIIPKVSSQEVEFHFQVDSSWDNAKYERGIIPGQHIYKDIDEVVSITDLSTKKVDGYAQGKVTVTNKSDKKRSLIIDTQLITENNLVFLTNEKIEIEPNKSKEVSVRASEKGTKYEIGPAHFTIKLLPDLKKVLYADSSASMTKGKTEIKIIKKEDLDKLLAKAKDSLKDKHQKTLESLVTDGNHLSKDSISFSIEDFQPKSTEITKAGGKLIFKDEKTEQIEVEKFELNIKAELSAFAYKESDIIEIAKAKSSTILEENFQFLGLTGDAEKIPVQFERSVPENGVCYFVANVKADVVPLIEGDIFDKSKLVGFNKADIIRHYKGKGIAEEVEITFWPFWNRSVPINTNRVEIKIDDNRLNEEDETPQPAESQNPKDTTTTVKIQEKS